MRPTNIDDTTDLKELYKLLGYIDPCPNAGFHNKTAMKLRAEASKKINISQYKVGNISYWDEGGWFKKGLYCYKDVYYS